MRAMTGVTAWGREQVSVGGWRSPPIARDCAPAPQACQDEPHTNLRRTSEVSTLRLQVVDFFRDVRL